MFNQVAIFSDEVAESCLDVKNPLTGLLNDRSGSLHNLWGEILDWTSDKRHPIIGGKLLPRRHLNDKWKSIGERDIECFASQILRRIGGGL